MTYDLPKKNYICKTIILPIAYYMCTLARFAYGATNVTSGFPPHCDQSSSMQSDLLSYVKKMFHSTAKTRPAM